ncbi:hypothetical protein TPA0908_54500 [Micromonospora sp. AKA38]|nr:hypothetical protein TPA0908_54500 [Micromonospora sp. AKA38]
MCGAAPRGNTMVDEVCGCEPSAGVPDSNQRSIPGDRGADYFSAADPDFPVAGASGQHSATQKMRLPESSRRIGGVAVISDV